MTDIATNTVEKNHIFPVLKTVHNMIFSVFRLYDYKN